MDLFSFDSWSFRSNIICCELVTKINQYINILQVESNHLSSLQFECNELLDKFYASKDDFDFLINHEFTIKYLGEDKSSLHQEYIKEFSTYVNSIWQMGKYRFSEKAKKTKYFCFVGNPLSEVMSTIQSFVDEVMTRLTYMPYHSDCCATMQAICSQIITELQGDCLTTADACLRQYTYLQSAIPFLQELRSLVLQYLSSPHIHTPKEFLDCIILQIPSVDKLTFKEDTKDMIPFRFVVDLLNGKLLDDEILDHNSEIKPVVEDDVNFKRSVVVMKTVEWILQQYKIEHVSKLFKNSVSPCVFADFGGRKKAYYAKLNHFASPRVLHTPRVLNYPGSPVDLIKTVDLFDLHSFDWSGVMSPQRKFSRKGRKNGPNVSGVSTSSDLQPIKLHILQTPFLPPLL